MALRMTAVLLLNELNEELIAWGKSCGLTFNAQKTVAVLFKRNKQIPSARLTFDGKMLDYSETVTYLGVRLDEQLHWGQHISNKIDKAKRYLHKLANLTRCYELSDPQSVTQPS